MKCEEIFHNCFLNKYINKIEIKIMAHNRLEIPVGYKFKNNYKFTTPQGYDLEDMKKGGKWENEQNDKIKKEDIDAKEITKGEMVEKLVNELSQVQVFK